MYLKNRIAVLTRMGEILRLKDLPINYEEISRENSWFTTHSVNLAIKSWGQTLTTEKIHNWLAAYPEISKLKKPALVQVIMAGNLPFVGLHDLISVFISGHFLQAKLSSKDTILIPWLIENLSKEFPELKNQITFSPELRSKPKAIIASGSNLAINSITDKYSQTTGLFRGNRHSIAILNGTENIHSLDKLCVDIKSYFGLGCRNVTHLLIPDANILSSIHERLNNAELLTKHSGYRNSLNQQRAIYKLTNTPFMDGKDMILTESKQPGSAMGVLHYSIYNDIADINTYINNNMDQIQCIVSNTSTYHKKRIPFGETQFPELWDYADGEDTLVFLQKLENK